MRHSTLLTLLALSIMVLSAFSLAIGPADSALGQSLSALFIDDGGPLTIVMREIRLPRMILGILVGFSLGLSGAAMQGYLRNPLAEPGLLGVSGTASLGAVIALQTGFATLAFYILPLAAITGAILCALLLFAFSGRSKSTLALILSGVAVSALAGALTSLVLNLSPNPWAASEIMFWMMGSLANTSFRHVWLALPLMVLGWAALLQTGRAIDALTLGEDAAATLGINLYHLRLKVIFGTAFAVGAATAVAGAIGFVGLVIPHILRPLVGARPSKLLLASGLGGAALVLATDVLVRVIVPSQDLKLGVIMALIGSPLFLHLIFTTGRREQ